MENFALAAHHININWHFIMSMVNIIFINIILSGDNAVVIAKHSALARHRLWCRDGRYFEDRFDQCSGSV